MHIGTPELNTKDGDLTWSVPIRGLPNAPERLWFRLPESHADLVTRLADPAVIGLVVPAMHASEVMEIEGSVTDELVHSITHGYQHILEAVVPDLNRIPLEVADAVASAGPAEGVGTAFSGGIDSFAVLAEHFYQPVPEDLRLTHLTLFNVGAMTSGESGRRRFRRVHALLTPAAERIGLPFIPIDSNLDDFYRFTGFAQTHGPRNLSAATLLQSGLGRFYFGSSLAFARIAVRRSHNSAYSDPISTPLLETRQFRPIFHGSQYTRAEKTIVVAEIEESHESLTVCTTLTADGRNCSRCSKCLRTQFTLDLIGHLDSYDRVFDVNVYKRLRNAYVDEVAWSRNPATRKVRDFAQSTGFRLPFVATGFVRSGIRRVARKVSVMRRLSTRQRAQPKM